MESTSSKKGTPSTNRSLRKLIDEIDDVRVRVSEHKKQSWNHGGSGFTRLTVNTGGPAHRQTQQRVDNTQGDNMANKPVKRFAVGSGTRAFGLGEPVEDERFVAQCHDHPHLPRR